MEMFQSNLVTIAQYRHDTDDSEVTGSQGQRSMSARDDHRNIWTKHLLNHWRHLN